MAKLLLVEDDKSLREIYGVRLKAEGYDIISAGDGEQALAIAVKERPDLIISDVMMPKISGFDMLDILRSTPETRDMKVIMMTALSSEDQRSRGESLGANRYLVKSQIGIEDVVRTVHEVLGDMPAPASPTPNQIFNTPTQPATVANPVMQAQPIATDNLDTQSTTSPLPQSANEPIATPTTDFVQNSSPAVNQPPIEPVTTQETQDIANLINQELSGFNPVSTENNQEPQNPTVPPTSPVL